MWQRTARGVSAIISSFSVSTYGLALGPCVNVIFKPEKGEGGIPSSTGFLKRSSAMRQIDFLPLFLPFCRLGKATHPHILWFWKPFPLAYRQKPPKGFQRCTDTDGHAMRAYLFLRPSSYDAEREDKDVEKMFAPDNCVKIS